MRHEQIFYSRNLKTKGRIKCYCGLRNFLSFLSIRKIFSIQVLIVLIEFSDDSNKPII